MRRLAGRCGRMLQRILQRRFAQIRDGAYTAAIEGGADALQAEILAGHRVGIKDAYLKRKPEMVTKACKAVEKYYFRRGK